MAREKTWTFSVSFSQFFLSSSSEGTTEEVKEREEDKRRRSRETDDTPVASSKWRCRTRGMEAPMSDLWIYLFDDSEKVLGKKKLSEEDKGKRRKKLRVDYQPEARPKLPAGTQLVEIPEFFGDYVDDMLGYADRRAHAEGEFELEGELDMLVKGAKTSMMLAGDDLEAKTKECQREAKKRKALETEVEELGTMVHASRNRILRDFQNSQEYKHVLQVNYSEGYTDMLNMCIHHLVRRRWSGLMRVC
ncbi:hypothetical protein M0R45_031417 [Rubus argutus]|uniref:Uncharacterized protein n=1 Tax=Rubus argutus TaxID=59490 RepID=A0AAW1WE81_RUBAR